LIKAMQLSLIDLLKFQPEEGQIILKDKRMIISSADALGLLRKDLIAALGMERAKRFLLRHGWNSGINDAVNLNDMFEWSTNNEWLLAGPQMHNICGNGFSKIEQMDVNPENGTIYVEGTWTNSYEAEQHLLHFPIHHEPVCYNLIGYAGGYSSVFFGKKVIFKEVECIGKGDKECRFIGKTVEEWGNEITNELINYEDDSLADELDCAYRRIEKQREVLTLGYDIHKKLTNIVLEGKGLDIIAKTVGESLKCSVIVEDPAFNLLASYGNLSEYTTHSIKDLMISSNLSNKQKDQINQLVGDRKTIELDFSTCIGQEHRRLITPIVFRDQIYGFVSLFKNEVLFGELETTALERTAMVCAVQMFVESTSIETEQRMKGKLLDELLNKEIDLPAISKRIMYLGYNLTDPHYVFVFQLETIGGVIKKKDGDFQIGVRNKIINLLTNKLTQSGYNCLISEKLDQVYALVPQSFIEQQRLALKQYGEYLIGQITDHSAKIKVTIGISNICRDISSYYKGYQEAIKAVEIAKIKRLNHQVILSSELGHLGLLLNARNPEELESFANEQLGQLYEYDQKNRAELMKTLYYFVTNEHNLHKTARIMNISISGMRYRLRRIKELLEIDLIDSSIRFEIQLALEILLVLGKLEIS
jgi:PucR family transcriptional regulator, purine catabolism regulatory protein